MRRMWVLVGALALVTAACAGTTDLAGSNAENFAAAAAPTPGSDPVGEGIQVHGDWTITVVNPDGTVASHAEFKNALTATGATTLRLVLTGASIIEWHIRLISSQPPCASYFGCLIVEPGSIYLAPHDSADLAVANTPGVTLTGSVTAVSDGSIERVGTSTVRTDQASPVGFTDRTLAQPVDVLAGQQILVTVTISFS